MLKADICSHVTFLRAVQKDTYNEDRDLHHVFIQTTGLKSQKVRMRVASSNHLNRRMYIRKVTCVY